ncbi:MAG: shikimate kinase [Cyclobacteriaceae bacterium]
MQENLKIYLIGMPGSGKSTLGKQLAKALKLSFIDLDSLIVEEEKAAITEIFSKKGEDYFREIEKFLLQKSSAERDNFVMATGGGAACFFDNMEYMNATGITVYIEVPSNFIADRLSSKGLSKRPLLRDKTGSELLNELDTKLKKRQYFYEKAKIKLDFEHHNLEALQAQLENYFSQQT